MLLDVHLWIGTGNQAQAWVDLMDKVIVQLAIEFDAPVQHLVVHTRTTPFGGRNAQQLFQDLFTVRSTFRLHVLVLTNRDIFYGRYNGANCISGCLADKILLANAISKVIGNSRILILDLINPDTAALARFDEAKAEIKDSTRVTRSKARLADFIQISINDADHCQENATRHMCEKCVTFVEDSMRESFFIIHNTIQVFGSES